jgi:hypothetical protein
LLKQEQHSFELDLFLAPQEHIQVSDVIASFIFFVSILFTVSLLLLWVAVGVALLNVLNVG